MCENKMLEPIFFLDKIFFKKSVINYSKGLESKIGIIYKREEDFFLITKEDKILPISIKSIDDCFLELNSKQFFCISKTVIINRAIIFCFVEQNDSLIVILKSDLDITFQIASNEKESFKDWFRNNKL